jgi:hypothetical protein
MAMMLLVVGRPAHVAGRRDRVRLVAPRAEAGAAAAIRVSALAGVAALDADRALIREIDLALEVVDARAVGAVIVEELNAARLTVVEAVAAGAATVPVAGHVVLVADALARRAGPLPEHALPVHARLIGEAAEAVTVLVREGAEAHAVEADLVAGAVKRA